MWKIEGLNDWKKFDIITDESTIPQFKKKQKYTKIVVKNNIDGTTTLVLFDAFTSFLNCTL